MDGLDFPLFAPEAAPEDAQRAAMAAALRQRAQQGQQLQAAGLLMGMGNNPSAGNFGQLASAQGMHAQQMASEAETRRQQQAIEAQHFAQEQRHAQAMEGLERLRLAQGKFASTPYGPMNTRTGEIIPQGGQGEPGATNPLGGLKPHEVQQLWTEFQKAISKTTGRSNLGAEGEKRVYAIERLEGLLNKHGGLTPEEMRLLETDLASVYAGGGAPTESAIEHLHAGTWKGSLAKTLEYALNTPQDAGASAFLQRMKGNVGELKGTIGRQILEAQTSQLPRYYKMLRPSDPDTFDNVLRANGIDPALLDETGKLKPRQEAAPAATPTRGTFKPDPRYLYNKADGGKTRILKGPDGKPAPGAKVEPNPDFPSEVASRG